MNVLLNQLYAIKHLVQYSQYQRSIYTSVGTNADKTNSAHKTKFGLISTRLFILRHQKSPRTQIKWIISCLMIDVAAVTSSITRRL